jgi:ornithine cyclodeaminase
MSETVGVQIEPLDSARAAVSDADVVICSTISNTPVLETDWISPGTHVQNVGPKFQDSSELPVDLYETADVLVTDAPAQLADYGDRFLVAGTPHEQRVVSLGMVILGTAPGRTNPEQVTLFCSLGLAGTEVALADRLLQLDAQAMSRQPGS